MLGIKRNRKPADAASPLAGFEAPRPVNRVFSHPVILFLCLCGAVLLIQAFDLYLPETAKIILTDRYGPTYPFTVQNVMWVAFALGLGELLVRWRDARMERRQLRKGMLPEDDRTILQAPDLRGIYMNAKRHAEAVGEGGGGFLPRLIQRTVAQFQTSRSIDQANALLSSSLELYLHEIDLRYSVIRYIVWVIPTLGFIGTVVGISLALAYAGGADTQDPTLLAELTKRLAVAFNTTLLALVLSAVLVLGQHLVQALEERTLNRAGQYCLDNLINRLYER